jgi:TonB family protein
LTASPKVRGEVSRDGERQAGTDRNLIVLTHDPALAAAVQELTAGGVPVGMVEDLRALADLLMQDDGSLVLLDAQALGVPVDAAVDAIKNQFPEVRLLVAGHAAEQTVLASRIASQKVFRFVHKPASPQRLKLFVDAASIRQAAEPAADQPLAAASSGATPPPHGSSSMLPILAGVAAVVALAVGGWLMMRKEEVAVPGAPPAVQAPASPELTSLLDRAASALAAGRLVGADGSSAAELYREVLRLDADNQVAKDGFDDAIDQALSGAEKSLLDGKLEDARVTAEMVRLIVPDNSRLSFLNTQIERELARLSADASQRQALEARQAQIRAAVALVEERIASGSLVDPVDDNAVTRFQQAQAIGAGDPLVRAARDAVVAALLTAADHELSNERPVAARRFVEAAGTVNSSAPGLDFARRRIDEAMVQQATQSTAAPVVISPVVVAPVVTETPAEPAAPAAGIARPAGNVPVSASTLKVVRRVPPEYPQFALESNLSGWVEMEFTVARDGSVRDVKVVESEPRRTFDAAAMAAMRRYHYEPVIQNGEPVEQRARLRMRFTPQEDR